MTKTDELISKLEELVEELDYPEQSRDNSYIKKLESEISQLKRQIKKEEIIKRLSGEKIEDIPTFTSTTNPDVMLDTCCGKYKEEVNGSNNEDFDPFDQLSDLM